MKTLITDNSALKNKMRSLKPIFLTLFCIIFLIVGFQLNYLITPLLNKNPNTAILNGRLNSTAVADFNGDGVKEVAILYLSTNKDKPVTSAEIRIYDLNHNLLARKDTGLNYDGEGGQQILAKKFNKDLNKDNLFYYRGSGTHGWALSIMEITDDKIINVTCQDKDNQEEKIDWVQFSGDGGLPDFNTIVNDFDNDGNLEIISLSRDWEKNWGRTDGKLFYVIEKISKWDGKCFIDLSEKEYNQFYDKYIDPDLGNKRHQLNNN